MFRTSVVILTAFFAFQSQAGVRCLPSPAGPGTIPLAKSWTKGNFIAYYCPEQEFPELIVCAKRTCNLVGTARSIATVASSPSLDTLNAELAKYDGNPYVDPELVAVWKPYAKEIVDKARSQEVPPAP